ncbi:MAG TPA: pseudouridine synthase [Desulfuromonadaceae bacterium]
MLERLQKILAAAGVASRRAAEGLITAGRVAVNDVVVTELGAKADPLRDRITLDGAPVRPVGDKLYILLNKPVGYVTTLKDPQGRPVVTDLLKGVKERVYPVGRLDYNTEGLLLLTNDGELANRLAHPRHEVEKEYLVRVRGGVDPEQLRRLAEGVEMEDGRSAPAVVRPVRESENNTWISITIHEGRYRQVRRMCEAVGLAVVRLKRTRYGTLASGELKPGQFRFLIPDEVDGLRALCGLGKRRTSTPAPASSSGGGKRGGRRPRTGS